MVEKEECTCSGATIELRICPEDVKIEGLLSSRCCFVIMLCQRKRQIRGNNTGQKGVAFCGQARLR